jgi:hypothetical protein
VALAARIREANQIIENLVEALGVERDHLRTRRQAARDRANVLVGDGADRAQRLGDDQVRRQRRQRGLVQLIEGVAAPG